MPQHGNEFNLRYDDGSSTDDFTGAAGGGDLTDAIQWRGQWRGGFAASGTWGGATAKLQFSIDGGTTWIDVGAEATLTDNGGTSFTIPFPCLLNINVASAGASTDLKFVVAVATDLPR